MAACFMLAGLQGLSAQEKADSLSAPDSLMAMESAPINLNVDSIVNKTKKLKTPKDCANTGNCHSSMADSWAVSMQ